MREFKIKEGELYRKNKKLYLASGFSKKKHFTKNIETSYGIEGISANMGGKKRAL
jgi:hypothetical protein